MSLAFHTKRFVGIAQRAVRFADGESKAADELIDGSDDRGRSFDILRDDVLPVDAESLIIFWDKSHLIYALYIDLNINYIDNRARLYNWRYWDRLKLIRDKWRMLLVG